MMTFETFSLDPDVLDALRGMGYLEPTPIQKRALPLIMEGHDLMALAETGSGKTAACAIPVCHGIDTSSTKIQALIVVPTRELALQYASETQKIGKVKKVKAFALFGGEDMGMQRAKLKHGVHVLVATPGRLIDFIYSRAIDLNHVETLILDEADQMLSMGFIEDLEFIVQCLVHEHQTLLFSATMPDSIKKVAKTWMKKPREISLIGDKPAPAKLEHQFLFCPKPREKKEALFKLLKQLQSRRCIIFGNSRREVEELSRFLKKEKYQADFLHGGLMQNVRTSITNKFAKGKIHFLVASDVAARGLDFSSVTHVINFHFPFDQEAYLHRSGRTGRYKEKGTCITLVTSREFSKVRKLLKYLERKPVWIGPPPKNF